ncbi:hypothetical protein BDW74DRAFT_163128, partial [Aspergillus multicolor]|uniref:uncharacterized protein n=1 Tax=Aspergillus multicolor TaxID=41759 RepID=UPI003CCDD03D
MGPSSGPPRFSNLNIARAQLGSSLFSMLFSIARSNNTIKERFLNLLCYFPDILKAYCGVPPWRRWRRTTDGQQSRLPPSLSHIYDFPSSEVRKGRRWHAMPSQCFLFLVQIRKLTSHIPTLFPGPRYLDGHHEMI